MVVEVVAASVRNLVPINRVEVQLAHPGYPHFFAYLIGAWQAGAAVVIIAPGRPLLKQWAYGVPFPVVGAVASHLAAGDGVAAWWVPPCLVTCASASWVLRPADRRLLQTRLGHHRPGDAGPDGTGRPRPRPRAWGPRPRARGGRDRAAGGAVRRLVADAARAGSALAPARRGTRLDRPVAAVMASTPATQEDETAAIAGSIERTRRPDDAVASATAASRFPQRQASAVSVRQHGPGPLAVGSSAAVTRRLGRRTAPGTKEVTHLQPPRTWRGARAAARPQGRSTPRLRRWTAAGGRASPSRWSSRGPASAGRWDRSSPARRHPSSCQQRAPAQGSPPAGNQRQGTRWAAGCRAAVGSPTVLM